MWALKSLLKNLSQEQVSLTELIVLNATGREVNSRASSQVGGSETAEMTHPVMKQASLLCSVAIWHPKPVTAVPPPVPWKKNLRQLMFGASCSLQEAGLLWLC